MKKRFPGGIHPKEGPGGKAVTSACPIEVLPPPARVVIPMSQHIGAPCSPTVKVGDKVKIGQVIGEKTGFVSASIHASVSGTVKSISPCILANGTTVPSVCIDNDFKDEWIELAPPPEDTPLSELCNMAGLVGLGGATFPTAVKVVPPKGTVIDTVILNGAECEPYLSADHRLMLERPQDVLGGLRLIMASLSAKSAYIGIEMNKPDAIGKLTELTKDDSNITIVPLPVNYPQGGEKQLIYAVTKRTVPAGALPSAVGCLVCNVGTSAALYKVKTTGQPVIDRVTTIAGRVARPGNYLVRIGTQIADLIEAAGGILPEAKQLIYGGPMMGMAINRTDIPVTKGCSGITIVAFDAMEEHESPCIRCGRCASVCPMLLMPTLIDHEARKRNFTEAERLGAMNCIECGSCTYVCPAKRSLTQSCRISKRMITAARKKGGK